MIIACLIISTLAFILSMISIIWLVAKHFSSHKIEYIDPMANMRQMFDNIGMGKPQGEEYRGLEDAIPADADEFPKKR